MCLFAAKGGRPGWCSAWIKKAACSGRRQWFFQDSGARKRRGLGASGRSVPSFVLDDGQRSAGMHLGARDRSHSRASSAWRMNPAVRPARLRSAKMAATGHSCTRRQKIDTFVGVDGDKFALHEASTGRHDAWLLQRIQGSLRRRSDASPGTGTASLNRARWSKITSIHLLVCLPVIRRKYAELRLQLRPHLPIGACEYRQVHEPSRRSTGSLGSQQQGGILATLFALVAGVGLAWSSTASGFPERHTRGAPGSAGAPLRIGTRSCARRARRP